MKYSYEVEINAPRPRVVQLLDDPQNALNWQPDIIRIEPIAGTPGQPGAQTRLVYRAGAGEFEAVETIKSSNLPDGFASTVETNMGTTTIAHSFVDHGASTRYLVDTTYTAAGVMKLFSFFLRGIVRKQTQSVVDGFKIFAESQAA